MKKKIEFIVIHCTATPEGREVTPENIRKWHLSPAPIGRGWKQVGYTKFIDLQGEVHELVPNNLDGYVDSWEITNGVSGKNSVSLHICYAGGCDKKMKPKNTLNPKQTAAMRKVLLEYIGLWSWVKIAGHNQFAAKACPSFDTVEVCTKWGFPSENIYNPKKRS